MNVESRLGRKIPGSNNLYINFNTMSRIIKSSDISGNRPLTWVLLGASVAPFLVIIYSYIKSDPGMRITPILILMTIIGAIAGRLSYQVRAHVRFTGWQRRTIYPLSILLYAILIALGFILSLKIT